MEEKTYFSKKCVDICWTGWYYKQADSLVRRQKVNIRVWRSLVSRLNGVQEASSSNLDTRTKKVPKSMDFGTFSFCVYSLRSTENLTCG